MMDNMGWYGGWGMGFGWIFMILFWGVVILGIVALAKSLLGSSAGGGAAPGKNALELLKERYARGEISKEEFEQKRRDLEQ